MTFNIPSATGILAILATAAFITHPLFILLFLGLIVLPGYCIVLLLAPNTREGGERFLATDGPIERVMTSAVMGLAFIPVLTFLFKLLSLPLNAVSIMITLFVLAGAAFGKSPLKRIMSGDASLSYRIQFAHIGLLVILFLSLFSRLYPIRHLDTPLFEDPALEGMISRLIIDHKGIPGTWDPYVHLPFRHQPGFASIMAWFSIFSHLPIPRTILLFTNTMHALLPFSIYVLAYVIFEKRAPAIIAGIFGLIAAFPAMTFVAGMNATVTMFVFVPLAAAIISSMMKMSDTGSPPHWRFLPFLVVLFAGGLLTHLSFIAFFLLLSGPFGIWFLVSRRETLKRYRRAFAMIGIVLVFLFACVGLFFRSSLSNRGLLEEQWDMQASYINPEKKTSVSFLVEPLFYLFSNPDGAWFFYLERVPWKVLEAPFRAGILMTGLFAYALFRIWRDRHDPSRRAMGLCLLAGFALFIFFSSVQSALRIPFPAWYALYPTRVKFFIIVPLSLLMSYPFLDMKAMHLKNMHRFFPLLLLLLMVPKSLLNISDRIAFLSNSIPFSKSDGEAVKWIEKNTPKDAVILNTIRDIEAGVFIGGAGQWIPALAGRSVVFPPLSLTEDVLSPVILNRMPLMGALLSGAISDKAFLEILRYQNVQYLFLSPRTMQARREFYGTVDPRQFLASPYYDLKYQNEDSYVFSVSYPS